jgi:lipopolysaccharide/colanic/teichoic acid biosynthesis glycosyltransferase
VANDLNHQGLTNRQKIIKRLFDLFISFLGTLVLFLPIVLLAMLATISTGKLGLYRQERVGLHGKLFMILKIRTMVGNGDGNTITLKNDKRVTTLGRWMRLWKLDELPQFVNVLLGDMSLVGPRPDVRGYADELSGSDRIILSVRPGITGPATIKYNKEEELLLVQKNPQKYNDEVIWPDKVSLNKAYVRSWSFRRDLIILWNTFFS